VIVVVVLDLAAPVTAAGTLRAAGATVPGTWLPGTDVALPSDSESPPDAIVFSVSCPAPGSCDAVGEYVDTARAEHGLLIDETDGVWQPGTAVSFEGAEISCPSVGNCSATGGIPAASGGTPAFDDEVSGIWGAPTVASLPSDAAAKPQASFASTSCSSAGNCGAVGLYNDASGRQEAMLFNETAGVWGSATELSLPGSAESYGLEIETLSCPSPGNCAAGGGYYDAGGTEQAMVIDESAGALGNATEVVLPPDAAASPRAAIDSLSCWSEGDCVTVGGYFDTAGKQQAMVVVETSGSWAAAAEAVPPADANAQPDMGIRSIVCPSSGYCSGIGRYTDASGNGQAMVIDESAGVWSPASAVTLPADADSRTQAQLLGLACSSVGNCAAVGAYSGGGDYQGLLVDEVDGAWLPAVEAVPVASAYFPSDAIEFQSVSCAAQWSCSAAGTNMSLSGVVEGGAFVEDLVPPEAGTVSSSASTTSASSNSSSTPGSAKPPRIEITSGALAPARGSRVAVRLACRTSSCDGSVRLTGAVAIPARKGGTKTKVVLLGSATFKMAKGKRATVLLRLTRSGEQLLAAAKHKPRREELTVTVQGGSRASKAVLVS